MQPPLHFVFMAVGLAVTTAVSVAQPTNVAASTASNEVSRPSFTVRPGFRMELVADGNLAESPASLAFDERGRLYVAELRDYPVIQSANDPIGRIRLLEDSNSDGVFDTSTVFAEDLELPSAVVCSPTGIFVVCATEILYLRDTDGDDRADLRRVLLKLNASRPPESADQLIRDMAWGPDRRIHVTLSGFDGTVQDANASSTMLVLRRGQGFSFDPRTLQLRAEGGGTGTGLGFDDAGHKFFCSPSAALQVSVMQNRDVARNPYALPMPTATQLVQAMPGSAPVDCLIYRGALFPTNLNGQAFLASPTARAIYFAALNNKAMHPNVTALDGRLLTPFVTSLDNSFRPVSIITGPDDAIYIADMARTIYPGGTPIPEPSEDDPSKDRKAFGRIWRLAPIIPDFSPVPSIDFSDATSLIAALGNSNAWVRATAGRLLLQVDNPDAAKTLRGVMMRAKWPVTRVEVLRSLNAAGAVTVRDLKLAMADKHPMVRSEAALLTVNLVRDGQIPSSLWRSLVALSTDSSPSVQLQAALTMGYLRGALPSEVLTERILRNPSDVWMQRVLKSARPEVLPDLFIDLLNEPQMRGSNNGFLLLVELAVSIGLGGTADDVSDCLGALRRKDMPVERILQLANALAEGLEGSGRRLPDVDAAGHWATIATTALDIAIGGGNPEIQAEALKVVCACVGKQFIVDDYLLLMLAPGLPVPMQQPAIRALAQQGFERDFAALTQRWNLWAPPEQLATLDALLEYDDGVEALLTALAQDRIPLQALTSTHVQLLLASPKDQVRHRAARLFGPGRANRNGVLSAFLPALELESSAERGRAIFGNACSACHRIGGVGPAPNQMTQASPTQRLASVLDPSREIASDYKATVLQIRNGRTVWGVVRTLNEQVIELRTPQGTRRYLRSAITAAVPQGWSLMPDNITVGLTRQNIADVLAFLEASQ